MLYFQISTLRLRLISRNGIIIMQIVSAVQTVGFSLLKRGDNLINSILHSGSLLYCAIYFHFGEVSAVQAENRF